MARADPPPEAPQKRSNPGAPGAARTLIRYAVAILITALSVLIRWAFVPIFGYQTPYFTTYPAIMVISVVLGAGPGIAASIVGIWATETWLVEPIGHFHLGWRDAIRLALLFCPVVYLGYVGQRLRAARARAQADVEAARSMARFPEENPNLVLRVAGDGIVLYANRPARTWLEALGCTDDRLPEPIAQVVHRVLEAGRAEYVEHSGPDGRTWSLCLSPSAGDGGVNVYGRDVTERKRAEEALRESEGRFRVAQELSPDGFTILRPVRDSQGRVVDFTWVYENATIARLSGTDPNAVIGRRLLDSFPGHRGSPFLEAYQHVAETGEHRIFEASYQGESILTSTWFRIAVVPLNGDIAILAQDITERKKAEEAARRHNATLEGVNQILKSALTSRDEEELGRICLTVAERITDSKFGFIGELNERGLEDIAISDPGWDACTIMTPDGHRRPPGNFKLHGIYGRVLLDGKAVLTNDPAHHPDSIGTPPGHPPLKAFLGTPLIHEGHTIGMIAVGNRPGGYTAHEQESLEALAPAIVEAFMRKRAEEALRESEERLRLAQQAAHVGTFEWNLQTDRDVWTRELEAIYGLRPGEFAQTGTAWMELIHPEDRANTLQTSQQSIETGELTTGEWRVVWPDGSVHWLAGRWQVFKDASGQPLRMTGVNMDITERKRAEGRITADLAALTRLHNLSTATFGIESLDDVLSATMEAAVAIVGAQFGTLQLVDPTSKSLRIVAHHGHQQPFLEFFAEAETKVSVCGEATKRGQRVVVEDVETSPLFAGTPSLEVLRAAGVRSVQSTPLIGADGQLLGILTTHWSVPHVPDEHDLWRIDLLARQATDLIQQKQAEEERQRLLGAERAARSEAERANRLKDDFLSIVSHELRSPLNSISMWTEYLQGGCSDADELKQGLASIENCVRVQTKLVADLLDVSRITSGKLTLEVEPLNLAEVVRAAVTTVGSSVHAKKLSLDLSLEEAITISGDAARLQQVVWNLLSNAVKFTPAGGHIRVGLRQLDQTAEITISDNGAGITPEFLPHLFDRFRQAESATTRRHGGLGLGLSLARQLVEMHGGKISAFSEGEGKGATFTVTLPLQPDDSAVEFQLRADSVQPRGGKLANLENLRGLRVLVVEDDPEAADLVARFLRQAGATPATANSADEALTLLESFRPQALISDIGMPGRDGYDLIREIRGQRNAFKDLPAVALTAFVRGDDRDQALAAGYQAHVSKPINTSELLSVLASLVVLKWQT